MRCVPPSAAATGAIAGARLVLACAYHPASEREVQRATEALRDEAHQVVDADLLVIGNRGLNTVTGRLLGSVPSDAAR